MENWLRERVLPRIRREFWRLLGKGELYSGVALERGPK